MTPQEMSSIKARVSRAIVHLIRSDYWRVCELRLQNHPRKAQRYQAAIFHYQLCLTLSLRALNVPNAREVSQRIGSATCNGVRKAFYKRFGRAA